jgi:hypothetical protein
MANTPSSTKIVGYVVFYAVRVVSKESLWVCSFPSHVEAGSNTSTVAVPIKGSLYEGCHYHSVRYMKVASITVFII